MFIKIISLSDEEVIECKSYLWKPHSVEMNPQLDTATVVINPGHNNEYSFPINCVKGNEFIVMNESGKTIDRKVW